MPIKVRFLFCALLSLLVVSPVVDGALVSEGPSGLVYTPYANEGQGNAVNTVPDFSRAGYGGGGVAIPFVSAAVIISDGPGDDTALIQGAIDQLSSLPLRPDGFRGALLIRAGEYTVSSTLVVNASGVVIRGEGQQEAGGTRITYTATNQSDLFHVHGSSGPSTVGGSARSIVDTYVPVGATTLALDDTSPFAPGDLIRLTNTVNQAWIEAIGMDAVSPAWTPAGFELEFFRYIESVDGNQITLDAPIIQAIEAQYGGGTVERLSFSGAIENVGIENIRLESTFASDTDEDHGWEAIEMKRVRNGWVRQLTGRYFGKGLILIEDSSQFVTVQDCAFLDPKSQTTGSRKYSFYIDDASYALVQRCFTRGGRHDYVSGSKTSGPNVFVDSLATQASNDIGPHFRYATGELYDNIKSNNDINVQNRFNSGTSHGWSGAQVMFWNVEANNVRSDAPTGAMNWSVGTVGNKADGNFGPASAAEPFGIWESEGEPVQPRSLYYAQLAGRLGGDALRDVRLPQQEQGRIWAELKNWAGDGLLLDPLVIVLDPSATVGLNEPVAIRGRIRDLGMMDNLASMTWSQVSGPGTATFADSAAIETTASFTASGQYRLQLLADDGSRQISGHLVVNVIDPNDTIAPTAPTGLSLTPSHNRVSLDWADNGEADLGGYALYRREASGSYGFPLVTGIGQSHYEDGSVTNGTTYFYVVRAQDVNGNQSPQSGEESATPFDNDPPPDLSFNEPADGTAFLLGESFAVQVAASDRDGSIANVKLYLDGQLIRQENGAPYDWSTGVDVALRDLSVGSYTLEAVAEDDDGQTTTLAITLLIEPDTEAPMAPTGLEATAGNGAIFLQWAANSEADLAGYEIYRSEVSDAYGAPILTGLNANTFTDVSVTNGTRYYYKIAALDSGGNRSLLSAEVDATPRAMLDFGTDTGKLTVESAGFVPTIPISGSALHINDAYRITSGPVGHENFAFLKSFPGMAAADRNDFAITLEARLASKGPATANNYRYGIALFADSNDLEGAGLTAQLLYDNDTLRIVLRQGLNGAALEERVFQTVGGSGRPYDYPEGESYTFEINGTHGTGEQLDLFFTLSDGNLSETIQFMIDRSQYPGELFGGAARIRDEFEVDFDDFELFVDGIDPAPGDPTELMALPGNGSVSLVWDANIEADLASYSVYRSETPAVYGDALVEGLTESNYTDTAVQNGTTYYYRVTATDAAGNESGKSGEVSATPDRIVSIEIPASDNSYVRRDLGVQDVSETLVVKRNDWGNSFARLTYIRIPMAVDGRIGGIAVDDLTRVALKLFVTNNEPSDTLRLYALKDAAQFSINTLSETAWTGGTDGTSAGGHNLQGSLRPDGELAVPNALTTVELGSLTFAAGGSDLGAKEIVISDLDAFRGLIQSDTNNEITLIIRGTQDGNTNEIVSIFNTSGLPGPSLVLTGEARVPDSDADGMADDWETLYFGPLETVDGSEDADGDGTLDFFEYLFGTNPTDPGESRNVRVGPNPEMDGLVFDWSVRPGIEVGRDYQIHFSTSLAAWASLPTEHYRLEPMDSGGRAHLELDLTHDYGTSFFLKLVRP